MPASGPDVELTALRNIAPGVLRALRLSLERALAAPGTVGETLASELVNTESELAPELPESAALQDLVTRAANLGAAAPIVRLGDEDAFALLVSSAHIFDLVDRLDELEAALSALWRIELSDPARRREHEYMLTELRAKESS